MRRTWLSAIAIVLLVTLSIACTLQPVVPVDAPSAAAIIVDEQDGTVELDGVWRLVAAGSAHDTQCAWAPPNPVIPNEFGYQMYDSSRSAYAYLRPELPQPGTYELFARWCELPAGETGGASVATRAEIQVHPTRGRVAYIPVEANMAENTGGWYSLGLFYLEVDGFLIVSNHEGAVNGAVVVDAFAFEFRTPDRLETTPAGPPITPPQPSPTP